MSEPQFNTAPMFESQLVQLVRRVAPDPELSAALKRLVEENILESEEFQQMKVSWGSLPGALSEYKIRKIREFGGWLNRRQEQGIKTTYPLTTDKILSLADESILVCWLELWVLGEIRPLRRKTKKPQRTRK